jgi:hypothetical protein
VERILCKYSCGGENFREKEMIMETDHQEEEDDDDNWGILNLKNLCPRFGITICGYKSNPENS